MAASFLRLWKLSEVPVSLFGDEADVGYQAYSILKTGNDYYGNFLPIHFHSLAEWRTPLYLYSAVPTVFLFGINAWGVRLPAAIFGILGIYIFYLLIKQIANYLYEKSEGSENKKENLALLASLLLTISPWHIQYSRAGFEVTLLLFLLLLGILFFLKFLNENKFLWLSVVFFTLTPWVYSTAKFFTPIFVLFLIILFWKRIIGISRKNIFLCLGIFLILGSPIYYSTFFGEGSQRFNYISVFSDPTTEPEVGAFRLLDARSRGEMGTGLSPTLKDRIIHNKYTFWGEKIIGNYLSSFSTNFLFIKGDLNLRHSIGIGQFYRVESVFLLLGLIFFFSKRLDRKIKAIILFWIILGVVPSSITREGGYHATRLFIILPPLMFLISYGVLEFLYIFKKSLRKLVFAGVVLVWCVSFGLYQHEYWVHYPTNSERWWHSGFHESFEVIKDIEKDYSKVVITTANEPPWIFFAALYPYPPDIWQNNFPLENKRYLEGFGDVSYIDKFYFGSPSMGLYEWGKVIDENTLYLASEKEVKVNLITNPESTPGDLKLIKAISYPSGEPAYYLFTGIR